MNPQAAHRQKINRATLEAMRGLQALEADHSAAWETLRDSNCKLRTLRSLKDRLYQTAAIIEEAIGVLSEPAPGSGPADAEMQKLHSWIALRCERTEPRVVCKTRGLFEDFCSFIGTSCDWDDFLDLLEAAGAEVNGRGAYDVSIRGAYTGGLRLLKIHEIEEAAA